MVQSLLHVDASTDSKPQTVTDGSLGQQDGPLCVASDIIQDLAKANPAGIHGIEYVSGGDISMGNPEGDCIERDLEDKWAPWKINGPFYQFLLKKTIFNFHKLTSPSRSAKLPTKK